MTGWRVAASLDVLLGQLNALAPKRSKTSDGSIGDTAHAARDSDHNPWLVLDGQALVTARDYTHDPAHGLDCQLLAAALHTGRDERVKYAIWCRKIMSGAAGPDPWQWRPYRGANPHTRHLHLSVVADARCMDPHPWELPGLAATGGKPAASWPTVRRGSTGPAVEVLQRFLGVAPDGVFGPITEAAVVKYQKMRGLEPDGICGPLTWEATGL